MNKGTLSGLKPNPRVYWAEEVDALVAGVKKPVRVATTTAGTLTSSFRNGDTVDGVVLVTGDRILIKDQAAAADNGIYTVNASGAPTRATDFDLSAEVVGGTTVRVSEGSAYADRQFTLTTNDPITLGTTGLTFAIVPTGQELGYAERTTNHTSTNTTAAVNDQITGLSVTVVGTGRPVVVEFHANVRHSVATDWTLFQLCEAAVATQGATNGMPAQANISVGVYLPHRFVLTAGTSYTYTVGVQTQAATATVVGSANLPIKLTVREQ